MKKYASFVVSGVLVLVLMLVGFGMSYYDVSEAKETANTVDTQKVAVVNLDEGYQSNGSIVNYGNTLIENSDLDFTFTGLNDAEDGIVGNTYAAYIIIPSDFSSNVISINSNPIKSEIKYAINPNLNAYQASSITVKIKDALEDVSDSLGRIYLTSVLDEFHDVQDKASSIMARDQKDKEFISSIKGVDLITRTEIPELAVVENNIAPLNIDAPIKSVQADADRYDTLTRGFINDSSNELKLFKKNLSEDYSRTEDKSKQDLEIVNALRYSPIEETAFDIDPEPYKVNVDNVSHDLESCINDSDVSAVLKDLYDSKVGNSIGAYKNRINDHNVAISTYKTLVNNYVDEVKAYNQEVNGYIKSATAYKDDAQAVVNTLNENASKNALIDSAQNTIGARIACFVNTKAANGEAFTLDELKAQVMADANVVAVCGAAGLDTNSAVESFFAGTLSETFEGGTINTQFPDKEPLFKGQAPQLNDDHIDDLSVEEKDLIEDSTRDIKKQMKEEGTAAVTQALITNNEGVSQKAEVHNSSNRVKIKALNDNASNNETVFKTKYQDISELIAKDKTSVQAIVAFDPLAKLNANDAQSQLTSQIDDMKKIAGDFGTEITSRDGQYNEYVSKKDAAATEYTTKLTENLQDAEKANEEELSRTLSEAQSSRKSSSDANIADLASFSQKLAYTRLGSNENTQVIDHMVSPIRQTLVPIASKDSDKTENGVTKAAESMVDAKAADEKNDASGILPWIIVAAAVLAAAVGVTVTGKRKKSKSKMDF